MKTFTAFTFAWIIAVFYLAICLVVSLVFFGVRLMEGDAGMGPEAFWDILYRMITYPFS